MTTAAKKKVCKGGVCTWCVTSEKRQKKAPRPLWAFVVRTFWRGAWAPRLRTFKVRGKTEASAKRALVRLFKDPYWRVSGYEIARARRVREN